MAQFVVSYDLRKRRDYQSLYDRLAEWKALAVLESVYVINWDTDAGTIRDDLLKYMDKDDGLLVARLSGQAAWHNLDDASGPTLKKWIEGK